MSLVILGLGVYMIIFTGWSSKSKYRLIGSIRSIAITLRFELCMAIVFLSPVFEQVLQDLDISSYCPGYI
jgi:NADH:ubiquinone oxidoreductase subunit H